MTYPVGLGSEKFFCYHTIYRNIVLRLSGKREPFQTAANGLGECPPVLAGPFLIDAFFCLSLLQKGVVMSPDFISRLIGMVVLAIGGLSLGAHVANLAGTSPYLYGSVFFLVGALAGLVVTPYITVRPLTLIRQKVRHLPIQQLVAGVLGLTTGLIIAALSAPTLSTLPQPFNQFLPFFVAIIFGYLGVLAMTARQQEIFSLISRDHLASRVEGEQRSKSSSVLLDTSVIIDGRIADISRTGFVRGEMLIPRFILNELQHIADSPDTLRRNRGRRGLDMLRRLQKESVSPVRIVGMDVEEARDADDKLVLLAKQLHCAIVTNDYNLNRVAELQGVPVLNVNELANAVRAVYLPGEALAVHILQEGKEVGQGVGYLDDGTMVVVENGQSHIGSEVETTVTKVLQTAAGRMIFARPLEYAERR
jgi:uncharacterized protein YacL